MIDSTRNSWLVMQFMSWCILHVCSEYMQNEHISLKINEILLFLVPFALQMQNNIQQPCGSIWELKHTNQAATM